MGNKSEKRHQSKLEKHLIQEKGLTFSLLELAQDRGKTEIDGFNYKTWWIVDAIGHEIIKEYGDLRGRKITTKSGNEESILPQSEADLTSFMNYFKRMKEERPALYNVCSIKVRLDALGIRKLLNKHRKGAWRNEDVHNEVKNLVQSTIICESPTFYVEELGKTITYGKIRPLHLCEVDYIKIEDRKKHSTEPEYYYKFIFDQARLGLVFFSNLALGWYKFLPDKDVFYNKISGGAQMIFRAINSIGANDINVPLSGLCELTQLKTKNKTWKQKTIEGYLNELKKHNLIVCWNKDAKKDTGKKTRVWYQIVKKPINVITS